MLFDVNGVFMGEADDEMPPTRLPCALVALPCSDELSASSEVEGESEGEGEGGGEGDGDGGGEGEGWSEGAADDEVLMTPLPDIPIGTRVSHPSRGVGEIVEQKRVRQLGHIHMRPRSWLSPSSHPCGNPRAYSCLVPPPAAILPCLVPSRNQHGPCNPGLLPQGIKIH